MPTYLRKKDLKKKALSLVKIVEAVLYLTNHMTPESQEQIAKARSRIPQLSNTQVRRLIPDLKEKVKDVKETYGVLVDDGELIAFLERAESAPKGKELLVPLHVLREMFAKYPISDFNQFPAHARIGIPLKVRETGDGRIEVYTLETILFEDMCMLFNEARKAKHEMQDADTTKVQVKRRRTLTSATLITVYDFIEAYLNGIATDHYFAQKDDLDEKSKSMLTRGQRTFRFREKLLQYPKIVLRAGHPPFQENNCPEIAFLTGQAKKSRDAIVHPTAIPNLETFDPEREKQFFSLTFEEVQQAVDNAISLVRKIETCIRGDCKRVGWLRDRAEDGFFPDSTFD